MKRWVLIFLVCLISSAFALASEHPVVTRVRATHAPVHKHKAHKAGRHKAPKHRHHNAV